MSLVLDPQGRQVDFDSAAPQMDEELCNSIRDRLGDCTQQEFYEAYCAAHQLRFGEEFEPSR